jgi:hypothetical protein
MLSTVSLLNSSAVLVRRRPTGLANHLRASFAIDDGTEMAMLWDKAVTVRRSHVGGLLLASPLTAVVGWWAFSWPWESPNAPAWIQAVGSIAAILASVWIANAKDQRDETRRRLEEKKAQAKITVRLNIISHTVKSIHDFSVRLLNKSTGIGVFTYGVDLDQVTRSLEGYFEQLNKLDAMELPNEKLAESFFSVWGSIREAQVEVRLAAAQRESQDYIPAVDAACKRILQATHYWCETVRPYVASTLLTTKYADMCFKEVQQSYIRMKAQNTARLCPFEQQAIGT